MSYSRITERSAVGPISMFATSTDASSDTYVGQRFDLNDGRQVALVQNGGVALAAGKLVAGPATVANHQRLVVTAYTAANTATGAPAQVTVTLGGTAVLANEYALGYLSVASGTGAGQILAIASHPAQATTTGNVVISLGDFPITALDTSSTVSLLKQPYGSANGTNPSTNGVVVCPTSASGKLLGVSFYAVAASSTTAGVTPTYALVGTKGPWAILNHTGTTAGLDVGNSTQSTPVAGAVETYAVASNSRVGRAIYTGTDTEYGWVDVNL